MKFFDRPTQKILLQQALLIATILLGAHLINDPPPFPIYLFLVALMSLMLSARDILKMP